MPWFNQALASVVAMVICKYFQFPMLSCKYFQYHVNISNSHVIHTPLFFFINSLFPGEDHPSACLTNHALWTWFSQPRSSRSAVWCVETYKHAYHVSLFLHFIYLKDCRIAWQYLWSFYILTVFNITSALSFKTKQPGNRTYGDGVFPSVFRCTLN